MSSLLPKLVPLLQKRLPEERRSLPSPLPLFLSFFPSWSDVPYPERASAPSSPSALLPGLGSMSLVESYYLDFYSMLRAIPMYFWASSAPIVTLWQLKHKIKLGFFYHPKDSLKTYLTPGPSPEINCKHCIKSAETVSWESPSRLRSLKL